MSTDCPRGVAARVDASSRITSTVTSAASRRVMIGFHVRQLSDIQRSLLLLNVRGCIPVLEVNASPAHCPQERQQPLVERLTSELDGVVCPGDDGAFGR